MEFILNNRKYAIQNHELYINYLMVDNYFRHRYSKYDYDIEFDFITPLLGKQKVEFEDILEGTKILEELIEKEEINFIASGLRIDQHVNGNFKITYQDLEFSNIHVGEAIPLIIALGTLVNYKPALSLSQIAEELDNFIEKFRSYNDNELSE
ncbi:hypothetical protein [Methanobrevibacter sp.]|uniref:hypothetical protein n=1 Tax=Methanobrevibacter sp. TaxID=66852 RepID=UPI0026DF6307|nr:hypothetical protein [Methanobrevibacter sp.]MDO5859594.1 hypothetical protein [Methanobrevibacter sp.]